MQFRVKRKSRVALAPNDKKNKVMNDNMSCQARRN